MPVQRQGDKLIILLMIVMFGGFMPIPVLRGKMLMKQHLLIILMIQVCMDQAEPSDLALNYGIKYDKENQTLLLVHICNYIGFIFTKLYQCSNKKSNGL